MQSGLQRAGQKSLTFAASLGLILTLSLSAAPVGAQSRPELGQPGKEPVEIVAGEVLVKFKPGAPGQAVADAHRQNGGQEKDRIGPIDVRIVSVPHGQERSRAASYRANPNVAYAEVHGQYYALARPAPIAEPTEAQLIAKQWQYNNTGQTGGQMDKDVDAFEAWNTTVGSRSTGIAVLDSGIDVSHPDLNGNVVGSVNFTTSKTVDDRLGHGTHVAGSAGAIRGNGIGVAGTCPSCALYNVKALGDTGSGPWSGIANGIIWAANKSTDNTSPVRVINLSLGSYSPSQTVGDAVNYALSRGVVVVAAAGNDGQNWGFYPAAYPNVIAVAATDHNDAKASISNHGGNWVSMAAPGENIFSTATDHRSTYFRDGPKYATLTGTSMASPHVAGVAGLIASASICGAGDGGCVRSRIQATADKIEGTGPLWIHGRLNACRAVGGSGC